VEPLIRFRKYLTDIGAWNEAQETLLKTDCQHQVEQAVEEYMNTPKQPARAMFDYLFENLPKNLQEQREQAERYATSGAKHGH
ncbi:MAG TPA: hypothetical protein VLD59_16375, partial [Steroidobacteraceae bacterium]|nr:hypothetical protein [Steroidobacteraceae bacterium]